ncbi:Glycogen accumulation regulator GarA [Pseudobythopirellula maris]|uniref:Glycogen accumulation regulator GarA n=1 Tax=Pseudobythopirellula maris TaxID=2527991 RepID=A0A5C5ZJG1_9BACT|nr:FHA domain-containing protein [Pseudobythopirellula maris]TWT87157.1 Glycogen accumulation regulator GarA [Pseudobythopirellula maris]
MTDSIRIESTDLQTPEVEEYVETQNYLQRSIGAVDDQPWIIRLVYANWFYLAICSMAGALAGWAILEPWYDDNSEAEIDVVGILLFPVVAAFVGLFLGAAEGIICRNPFRALKCGVVGMGVGFVGGFVALIPTSIVFGISSTLAVSLWDNPAENTMPTGIALLVLMMGRSVAWAIAAIPGGMGQGIALKERKVIINGVVGALLGGLVGGLLFDPISLILLTEDGQATYSRAVGFAAIGGSVGLFVGLVEGWTKTAWLLMRKGPLAGKQFILFKDTTVLGSSPKADVYLFKDDAIEPRHAQIINRGGRFEIEDCDTPDGTYVNGVMVRRHVLQNGDQIVLGKTLLEFSVTEAKQT